RIVARGDFVCAKRAGVVKEGLELDLAIAQHVGIGRAACTILIEEMSENAIPVFGRKISRMKRDAKFGANTHGVGAIALGMTFAETFIFLPVLHEQAADGAVAVAREQQG